MDNNEQKEEEEEVTDEPIDAEIIYSISKRYKAYVILKEWALCLEIFSSLSLSANQLCLESS